MIFVPNLEYSCYVIYDKDTIRAFHDNLVDGESVDYTDYYVNSHYTSKDGSLIYNSGVSEFDCINSALLTNDIYYRNDLDSILIIFGIICIFAFYIPFKIFKTLFRKGKN